MNLEPDIDQRAALAAFNAAHPGHAPGLFVEGLALLERAMEVDPDATKPACERAYAWLCERKESELAEQCAERWRRQDAIESGK